MSSPINIALIGCGSIGEVHAECLSKIAGAKLSAYCDVVEVRAKHLCEKFGGTFFTTDSLKIFISDYIDAVYICTQTDTHETLAIKAAQTGKHIFIEKPLALTLKECYSIADAIDVFQVRCMTGFKLRFYPSVAKAKEFISTPIISIAQIMDERWVDDFWANDPIKGGGNVLSQGVHAMDLICYLMQSEPIRIFAEGGNFTHPNLKIFDNIITTITFANGATASVVIGDSGQNNLISKFSFQLFDGVKSVHLYNRLKSIMMHDGKNSYESHDVEESGLMEENKAFIHSLQNEIDPPTNVVDGIRATMMVLKAFESIKSGKPEEIILS